MANARLDLEVYVELQVADGLEAIKTRARTWLFEQAAPFWSTRGVHPDGMFVESFARDGAPIDRFRRVFVQARQIYSFCELGRLGWAGPWREVVEQALPPFLTRALSTDFDCFHSFDSDGEIIDLNSDLYNMAFYIFALGHAGEALGKPQLFGIALKVLERLQGVWARPQGGYAEGARNLTPPYRQNPHMHLLEAALALFRFTGERVWLNFAQGLADLLQSHFIEPTSGALREYFDENWAPLSGRLGEIVEPGHCFEWAWLMETAPEPVRSVATAEALLLFARRHGICRRSGMAVMEVTTLGEFVDARARLWPQTERLKSAVARFERTGWCEDAEEIEAAYHGLEKFFIEALPGLWCDKFDIDGVRLDEPTPASSFYHIVCALSTLLSMKTVPIDHSHI